MAKIAGILEPVEKHYRKYLKVASPSIRQEIDTVLKVKHAVADAKKILSDAKLPRWASDKVENSFLLSRDKIQSLDRQTTIATSKIKEQNDKYWQGRVEKGIKRPSRDKFHLAKIAEKIVGLRSLVKEANLPDKDRISNFKKIRKLEYYVDSMAVKVGKAQDIKSKIEKLEKNFNKSWREVQAGALDTLAHKKHVIVNLGQVKKDITGTSFNASHRKLLFSRAKRLALVEDKRVMNKQLIDNVRSDIANIRDKHKELFSTVDNKSFEKIAVEQKDLEGDIKNLRTSVKNAQLPKENRIKLFKNINQVEEDYKKLTRAFVPTLITKIKKDINDIQKAAFTPEFIKNHQLQKIEFKISQAKKIIRHAGFGEKTRKKMYFNVNRLVATKDKIFGIER